MHFICRSLTAPRNRFFQLGALTHWRRCARRPATFPAVTSSAYYQGQIGPSVTQQCLGLGWTQRQRWLFLPRAAHSYWTLSNQTTGCYSRTQRRAIGFRKVATWHPSLSTQHWHLEDAGCPDLLSTSFYSHVRGFHASPRHQAGPVPLLLIILKPVQKLLAIIVGR